MIPLEIGSGNFFSFISLEVLIALSVCIWNRMRVPAPHSLIIDKARNSQDFWSPGHQLYRDTDPCPALTLSLTLCSECHGGSCPACPLWGKDLLEGWRGSAALKVLRCYLTVTHKGQHIFILTYLKP
jgi:hypothetical protein